jgi:hypothetical protein
MKRLGKQRVEAKQLLNILLGETDKKGWTKHPCTLMWKGHEETLKYYHDIMICEWMSRGYNNTMPLYHTNLRGGTFYDYYKAGGQFVRFQLPNTPKRIIYDTISIQLPPWLDDNFCSRHRSTLLYKDPEHYNQFGWTETPKYEYIWPIMKEKA